MQKVYKYLTLLIILCLPLKVHAQWDVTEGDQGKTIKDLKKNKMSLDFKKPSGPVEMQADQVEYTAQQNVAKAHGNAVVKSGDSVLKADSLEIDRDTKVVKASGTMYLDTPQFQVDADSGTYNFGTTAGSFDNVRIFNEPFQIKGQHIDKDADGHILMKDGFLTTCDLDHPHYRMQSRTLDVWPGDKAVARGVTMFLGPVPVMYFMKFTQDLKEKPWFTFEPGYKKDLGLFLMTQSRFKINDYFKTTIHVDGYERMGFGLGADNRYNTPSFGSGIMRYYFINERQIAAKHPWAAKVSPTVQNERYRLEWRHQWNIDDKTQAVMQYYRMSDDVILKRYFEREYRRESNPSTYFYLNRTLPAGSLSVRVDHRVNRFVQAVDRTPEITYSLAGQPIGGSGFYLKTEDSFSNLVNRQASPTEDRRKTLRVDSNNEVTYPTHIGFVQFTPMVGGETTYYSRTIDDRRPTDVVRQMFKTGTDLSARFMKVMELERGLFGTDITRLRHIIAPGVSYRYQHTPTFTASRLNQFDAAIDGLSQDHRITFSLENKLQTKRKAKIVDLVRDLATVDYLIKQTGRGGQLSPVKNLLEITPVDWLRFVSETTIDHKHNRFAESNLDFYVTKDNKYGFDIGDRFARGQDHQLITQIAYIINPKWRIKMYDRFDVGTGALREENYTLTRDMHEWEMNMIYGQTRGSGIEFLMSFKLKAFPDQPLQLFSSTFHERKAGSQSATGF